MSKKGSLNIFEVKNPCSEDWEKMSGGDRVRFCRHCSLSVNNLSAMTRKEALKLMRKSGGRLCVRYVKNPETNAPVFARRLYQISRRASIAAGVLGASLTLSTLAYAYGGIDVLTLTNKTRKTLPDKSEKDKTGDAAGKVSGTITDALGAVIPNATVTLTNLKTGWNKTGISDENGIYNFANVAVGNYKVQTAAPGFKSAAAEFSVLAEKETVTNLSLDPSEEFVTVGEIAIVEFSNPLHRAVSEGDLERIRDLIAKGAGVNAKEKNYARITPLFLAVENGNEEIVQTLLSFGAKANARNDYKQTPLMRLDDDATPELARILLKHGAKINMKDDEGNTALIWAVENSAKPEVLQFLLVHGANLDEQNNDGETALMKAAYNDNAEAVRVLLEAGADANLKNKDGETALDLTGDEEIKKLLESNGAVKEENLQDIEN